MPGAYDELFDGEHHFILHTASPVAFKVSDVQKDLIDPAVQGYVVSLLLSFALLVSLTGFEAPLGFFKRRTSSEARN